MKNTEYAERYRELTTEIRRKESERVALERERLADCPFYEGQKVRLSFSNSAEDETVFIGGISVVSSGNFFYIYHEVKKDGTQSTRRFYRNIYYVKSIKPYEETETIAPTQ